MELNFDAVLRLTEALLPILRASAPSAIVNVASTAGRVARARTGSYSASKFALIGWNDALYSEERGNGVHVGLVLPGFIATEGFPATELRERALTRWIVSKPEKVAEAIVETGLEGQGRALRPAALRAGGGRPHRRAEPDPAGPLRRRRRDPDDEHRGRIAGLTRIRSPLKRAGVSLQYVNGKIELTLLAALALRSARIAS